jgi:hypothetical protein
MYLQALSVHPYPESEDRVFGNIKMQMLEADANLKSGQDKI